MPHPFIPPPRPNPIARVFLGPNGLRAGWTLLLFGVLWLVLIFGWLVVMTLWLVSTNGLSLDQIQAQLKDQSPVNLLILEFAAFHSMVGAGVVAGWAAGRQARDYFLVGTRPVVNFAKGLAAGVVSMAVLALLLAAGGWLRVSPGHISAPAAIGFGFLWALVFLTVAGVEEGTFRCFLQSTIARGTNFWVSLVLAILICLASILTHQKAAIDAGVTLGVIGFVPALIARLNRSPDANFWAAAWVTSTAFGLIHATNPGETYIGVVDAGVVGYAFCLAIKVTGSLWWSVGCHAAWDWMQTYFLGSADSGLVARGHLLTTAPAGPPLLSGGSTGPEGSLIGVAVDVGIIVALLLSQRRAQSGPPMIEA